MTSFSEENYLKAIFHLERGSNVGVTTNALAEKLETKASSVSEMIKKLSRKRLVLYRKYQGVTLSEEGKETAVEIIRKHRLWEYFLVEKLNFSWTEVHDVAEQLEHIQSEKLIFELDKFLGFPRKDPHGDPIPDNDGNFQALEKVLLAEVEPGQQGLCVGVRDSSREFLEYLDKNKIALGKRIEVLEREGFDQSLLILLEGEKLHISKTIANNLFLRTI